MMSQGSERGEPMTRELKNSMEVIRRDTNSIGSAMKIRFYPLVIEEGKGSFVTDLDGNKYLDLVGGGSVAITGHCHPKVVAAIKQQADKLIHNCFVESSNKVTVDLAERLKELTPGDFSKKVLFGLSGSDANECIVKLIPYYTKRSCFISFVGAYHGQTMGAAALSGHPSQSRFPTYLPVTKVPYPYCYRCPFKLAYPQCDLHCAKFIEDYILQTISCPEDTCALIIEPIQSDSGNIIPPEGFLPELKRICEKYGIIFVADEVKIGFGRTGRMFAIEHSGVVPDVITLAKSIASGMPLSACVARAEILDCTTASYLFTTGGNPISCAASLATIDVIKSEKLVENAANIGAYFMKELQELKSRSKIVGDVRGKGLIFGIEFVKDKKTKEPARIETAKICYRAWQKGLITGYFGLYSNVIEFTPPLNLSKEEVDLGVRILSETIEDVEKGVVSDEDIAQYKGW